MVSLPSLELGTLPHADGSATYSFHDHNIVCAVNGPIEPQRRDEHPTETFVEVNVRPVSGPGGPFHRLLERLLHRTLTALIHLTAYPRTLLQLTLQLTRSPDDSIAAYAAPSAPTTQSTSHVPLLPHLVNAAVCALLDANIAMKGTATAVLIGLDGDGKVIVWPGDGEARSLFAVAFKGVPKDEEGEEGEGLLLVETEGAFELEEYERAVKAAERVCRGGDGDSAPSLEVWLRQAVGGHVAEKNKWRKG